MKSTSIYNFLYEVDEIDSADFVVVDETGDAVEKMSTDSVDYQIDRFLLQYEKKAVESAATKLDAGFNESVSRRNLKFLLLEQEDEEDPFAATEDDVPADDAADTGVAGGEGGGDEAAPGGDLADDVVTNATIAVTEPADLPQLPIDMDKFVEQLNRLLAMPERLLDIRTVIVNRAKNYLIENNYSGLHLEEFEEKLNQTGIEIDRLPRFEIDGDEPLAIGAFAGGTGGLGGGGS